MASLLYWELHLSHSKLAHLNLFLYSGMHALLTILHTLQASEKQVVVQEEGDDHGEDIDDLIAKLNAM